VRDSEMAERSEDKGNGAITHTAQGLQSFTSLFVDIFATKSDLQSSRDSGGEYGVWSTSHGVPDNNRASSDCN
jgi:hypothetical protein